MLKRITNIFSMFSHSCISCGRTSSEASFSNRDDELCCVCKDKYKEEVFCCKYIVLKHGAPEMCPFCGTEFIMWGATIYKGNPQLSVNEHHLKDVYLPQVLHHKDGYDKYLERIEKETQDITDKNMANRYRQFYVFYAEKALLERRRISRKY